MSNKTDLPLEQTYARVQSLNIWIDDVAVFFDAVVEKHRRPLAAAPEQPLGAANAGR
jgi:hypothetical protein